MEIMRRNAPASIHSAEGRAVGILTPAPVDSRAPAHSAPKGPLPLANSFWTFPTPRSLLWRKRGGTSRCAVVLRHHESRTLFSANRAQKGFADSLSDFKSRRRLLIKKQ